MATRLRERIRDIIFNDDFACFNCGEEIIDNGHNHLCDKCFKQIDFIESGCVRCGEKVSKFDKYCEKCRNSPNFYFDANISVAKLDGISKTLIYRLKFGGKKYIAKCLACFMRDRAESVISDKIDYVCYVPVTNDRRQERGYNQSEEIAKEFSRLTNIKLYQNLFIKIKETVDQTRLNREERTKNLKDAFFIQDNADVKNKNLIIIDDVITTGATLNALAKILKKKGANVVYGLTFCHR